MLKVLCSLLLLFVLKTQSINLDISSIQMISDLGRLCWKQFDFKNIGYLKAVKENGDVSQFKIFQAENQIFCIENKFDNSLFKVIIPLEDGRLNYELSLNIIFTLPLSPALPIIRKKIVSSGVHFQLNNDFVGLDSLVQAVCTVWLIYGPSIQKTIYKFELSSNGTSTEFRKMFPEISFMMIYTCDVSQYMRTSSSIIIEKGVIYKNESIQPLQPFIKFPFRRFIVAQWKSLPNDIHKYKIIIYKMFDTNSEKCIKIFQIFKFSKDNSTWKNTNHCEMNTVVEDLGYFEYAGDGNIYVVLDMVELLDINFVYKILIIWQIGPETFDENFIYFEALPNEKNGIINSEIYNFEPSNYKNIREKISNIKQNVDNEKYQNDLNSIKNKIINGYDELLLLPSVSSSKEITIQGTKHKRYEDINKNCENTRQCASNSYPFFYLIYTLYRPEGKYVELIPIPKKTVVLKPSEVQMIANHKEYRFEIRWNILGKPTAISPSMYVITIIYEKNKTCAALYILTCRTCNEHYKEKTEFNSQKILTNWKRNCTKVIRKNDFFESADFQITFKSEEMIPDNNYRAELFAINLYTADNLGISKATYLKESLWRNYGNIMIIVGCSIFGVIALSFLVVWLKTFIKDILAKKDVAKDENVNTYYTEDENKYSDENDL